MLKAIPKKIIAPTNGKSGFARKLDTNNNHDDIDWSTKGERNVTVSYPNRRETKKEPCGNCGITICPVCVCGAYSK